MNGKPYEYGGGGGNGDSVDCSGFMSDIYSIYSGKPTRFTTDSDFAALGFKPGYQEGAFNIGTNGGVGENGHMAGTLPDGTNVESNGSAGVQYGGNAAGATDSQFSQQWHYPVQNTPSPGVQQTQRAAGKYTKDDFAIADGKKPWERDKESDAEDAAAIEIEAMLLTGSATDDYRKIQAALPPASNSKYTSIMTTLNTYPKAHWVMDERGGPQGTSLDYGAGQAGVIVSDDIGHDTFEKSIRSGHQSECAEHFDPGDPPQSDPGNR